MTEETVNGTWIRNKLKTWGIKSSQLASALNVSDSQVSQWLTGIRNPSPTTRNAISQYFSDVEYTALRKDIPVKNLRETINGAWIREKLRSLRIKNSQLAAALSVSDSQVSQWLNGGRTPRIETMLEIQKFLSNFEFSTLRNGKDVLKLSSLQFVAVYMPGIDERYVIMWNHFDLKLILHKCEVKQMSYIDLSQYRYLLLDPEYEQYSILYEFQFDKQLQLDKKLKGELAHNFDVIYAY